jgi:hypothetical protein
LKGYTRKIILNTELSAKEMQATGSLAVPALRHGFGIINWHQKLDRRIRKMLVIGGHYHPTAVTIRLYEYAQKRRRNRNEADRRSLQSRNYSIRGIRTTQKGSTDTNC